MVLTGAALVAQTMGTKGSTPPGMDEAAMETAAEAKTPCEKQACRTGGTEASAEITGVSDMCAAVTDASHLASIG